MSESTMPSPHPMKQETPLYSALEQYLLASLRSQFRHDVTIADLAHATGLPIGTVRMGLQWLLACGLVECLGDRYRLVE